jgi:hypothetical protein
MKYQLASVAVLSVLLTACGGGGGSDSTKDGESTSENGGDTGSTSSGGTTTGDTTTGDTTTDNSGSSGGDVKTTRISLPAGTKFVTQKNKCNYKFESTKNKYTQYVETGYEGDIKQGCEIQRYELLNGLPSLNITNVIEERIGIRRCLYGSTPYNTEVNTVANYKEGTVNGQDGCKASFTSPLPITITDSSSIIKLLRESTLASNTCIKTKLIKSKKTEWCDQKTLLNYTFTDDTGKTHKLYNLFEYDDY